MKTLNKQSCPTCGQSVNMREIGLYTGMVKALCRVWRFCEETDRWENIKASEFRGLMSGVDITRFADWKSMAPEMVNGERGYYNFNRQMLEDYFTGNIKVATKVLRDPLTKQDTLEDYRYVQDVANIGEFLDSNKEFIARYRYRPVGTKDQRKLLRNAVHPLLGKHILDVISDNKETIQ